MNTIPIILAADNNYAPYMSVLMISILKNAKSNPFLDFYLLVPDNFKEEYKNKIEKDCNFYKNKQINFVNMKKAFSETKRMISHITEQTYYRLRAAEILPDKYDKCIYLDIDTIVNCDLSDLYNVDLDDNYVAGVKGPIYHFSNNGNIKYCQKIGLPSIDQYINAGVLVLNLKRIRVNNITSLLCTTALNNFPSQDQDVINKVFYNHIKQLPFKYNVMTKYKSIADSTLPEYEKLCNLFGSESISEAISNPLIIHYADRIKPWQDKNCIFSNYWWKYAKCSRFYYTIIFGLIKQYTKSFKIHQLFSVKNQGVHKIITLFGIKIKLKNKRLVKEKQRMDFINSKFSHLEKLFTTAIDEELKTNYFISFSLRNDSLNKTTTDSFKNFISFQYDYVDTPSKFGVNIGDYVQSIAVLNLIQKLYPDTNIISFDRDNLGNYDDVPAFTIMQGWFSNSYTFLPNYRLTPVYIGMHVTNVAQNNIFKFLRYNPNYFYKETIGCRDKYTQKYFDKLGIPNYFSRCLTLTFPKRETLPTQNKIFLVNMPQEICEKLPKNIIDNAEIINQRIVDADQDDLFYYNSYNKYIKQTSDLLKKYQKEAKLIITPALHCASPCVAMGIPVILFENGKNNDRLSVLDGIIKKYSYDDFVNNNIDYNPVSPNIEDLKSAMINNLDLTVQVKKGMDVDLNQLNETRKFIQEYNII